MKRPTDEEIAKKAQSLYWSLSSGETRPLWQIILDAIKESHKFDNIPEEMGPVTQEGNR